MLKTWHGSGYDTSFRYMFPIIGRNGMHINDRFTPHPETYLSIAVDSFPNFFIVDGPNSVVGAGSLLSIMEKAVDFISWYVSHRENSNSGTRPDRSIGQR